MTNLPISSTNSPNPIPPTNAPSERSAGPTKDSSSTRASAMPSPPHSTCATCRSPPPTCGYPDAARKNRVTSTVATATTRNVTTCRTAAVSRAAPRRRARLRREVPAEARPVPVLTACASPARGR
ncbi:Uncharacterised protein [Mycobacteroides abscessus]|nr:Uncharacterised protein [Mycobacteroides abscessus]